MADVKKLIEERGQLDHQIKALVDKAEAENRNLNAEEKGQFDKLHTRDMELKERIDRQAALAKREAELAEVRHAGMPASAAGAAPSDKRADRITDEEKALALAAWVARKSGLPLTKRHKEAAMKYRAQVNKNYSPDAKNFDLVVGSNEGFRSLQHQFRSVHPNLQKRDVGVSSSALIPTGFVNRLELALLHYGPMWQTSEVLITANGNDLPWPTANDTGNTGELLGEAASVGSSVDPTISSMTLNAFKYSSKLVKVSHEIIEDSAFDLVSVLGDMLGERLGRITNTHFTTGTGSSQPRGIVTASTLGKTAASPTAITADELIDLQHSVGIAYRQGAAWMMEDATLAIIRKLKDSDGQYLLQPGLQAGVPDRILGSVVHINEDMASVAAGTKPIIYGQVSKYKARRVRSIRLRHLVERYADTDQEGFVAFMRADGDLLNAGGNPVKHLIMAAS